MWIFGVSSHGQNTNKRQLRRGCDQCTTEKGLKETPPTCSYAECAGWNEVASFDISRTEYNVGEGHLWYLAKEFTLYHPNSRQVNFVFQGEAKIDEKYRKLYGIATFKVGKVWDTQVEYNQIVQSPKSFHRSCSGSIPTDKNKHDPECTYDKFTFQAPLQAITDDADWIYCGHHKHTYAFSGVLVNYYARCESYPWGSSAWRTTFISETLYFRTFGSEDAIRQVKLRDKTCTATVKRYICKRND